MAATALAAITALVQMLPAILVVVGVLVVIDRRRRGVGGVHGPLCHQRVAAPRILRPVRPVTDQPCGWLLVPVWGPRAGGVHLPIVVDAEIIGEEPDHG